jgi:hypothetical protein
VQRRCGRCGTDFDDETSLSVCPHFVGERQQDVPAEQSMDVLSELMAMELEDLVQAYNYEFLPSFGRRIGFGEES